MDTMIHNLEFYLSTLKDELNNHEFKYEDGCFIMHLIEFHTVEYLFTALCEKLEDEKETYQTNYFMLYEIQTAITDLLLSEKQIAKHKTYLKKVYDDVVRVKIVNNELDNLIEKYK